MLRTSTKIIIVITTLLFIFSAISIGVKLDHPNDYEIINTESQYDSQPKIQD